MKKKLSSLALIGATILPCAAAWVSPGYFESFGNGSADVSMYMSNTLADSIAFYFHPTQSITVYWKESYQDSGGNPGGSNGSSYTNAYYISYTFDSVDYNTAGHYISDDQWYRYSYSNHWGFTDVWK
jgi:hypothetical protein